jgi:arsenite/tail-anchored protein-transporting ATPase
VLLNVRHLLSRRVVFFGGKGGVGKTTCSAAFALRAARLGRRVLLVSTDPAHSTSDIFGVPIGPAAGPVAPGLDALEIDPDEAARRYADEAKSGLAGLFAPGVVKEAARHLELAAAMPGAADAALFDRVTALVLDEAAHDLIVFDTAPTGHTLRLLRMPEMMGAWVEALARRRREATAAAAPEGADPVLALLEARAVRLAAVRTELARPDRVAVVLVVVPERLPIEETARAAHALEDSGLTPGGLVVNRVLPAEADGEYLRARRARERRYLDEIDRRFAAFPRAVVPQLEADVQGLEALDRVGMRLLADSAGAG